MKISDYKPVSPISLTISMPDDPKVWPPLTDEEKWAMQQPSTKQLLKMPVDEPFMATLDWRANPDAKTDEERVGMRHIDPSVLVKHQVARANRKFIYRDDRTSMIGWREGVSSVSAEKRERGIGAFRFTPPAEVTNQEIVDKAVGLVEYKSEPPVYEWKKITAWQALKHWLKGGEVKRESND